MNELDLVTGCKKGDNDARRFLYDSYARQMMGLCYRYAGNRETAEDLLHDGFIRIYEAIGKFEYRGAGSLQAWMSRVFTNVSLEYLRRNQQWDILPIEEIQITEEPENEDYEVIPIETLLQFVAELPNGYRTVLNLFVFENKSHREIGELLNIGETTSRSQYLRAKNLLAKKVKKYIESIIR
jgi:RNA polymerase sigma-70 factor (ECF subfamily)